MAYTPLMHKNPEEYGKIINIPFESAKFSLEKFFSDEAKAKYKKGNVLDVGCGDGSVTKLLKTYLDPEANLTACDISSSILKYAKEHLPDVNFFQQDACGVFPEDKNNSFDLVFSSFFLHWALDYKKVLANFHDLLAEDGATLNVFIPYNAMWCVYKEMANIPKWQEYCHGWETFRNPYEEKELETCSVNFADLMKQCGFTSVDVSKHELTFVLPGLYYLQGIFKAIDPFYAGIPETLQAEYMDLFIEFYVKLGGLQECNLSNYKEDGPKNINVNILVAIGKK